MPLPLKCSAMARLLAKSVALIAIYSIALQALLLGYLHAAHAGFDPATVICAGSTISSGHDRPSSPPDRHCDRCSLACNGASPAVIPPGAKFSVAPLGR